MIRKLGLAVGLILVAALTAGCAGKVPPTHYYMLEATGQPVSAEQSAVGRSIGVRAFQVDPPFDQDRIVYRIGSDNAEVGFYDYHRWAAPLGRMLPALVAAELSSSGVAELEPAAPGRDYDAYLWGRLLAAQEIDGPEGQRAVVGMLLVLQGENGEELWSQTVSGSVSMQTESVEAIVQGMRQALVAALGDARPGLAAALAPR